MQDKTPVTVYLKDYKAPDFLLDTVHLEFELDDVTKVKSTLTVSANPQIEKRAADLVLHGELLDLKSITLDGKLLDLLQYRVTEDSLIIYAVPEKFTLEIVTWIKPHLNTQLNGLYKSSGNFCTQCEAEGFRRITYFLDRPDVMARYTTTIIADKKNYPVLLSNGNCVANGELENGKHWVCFEDPFKKPSYLFALVAGNFELLQDQFVTMRGRTIDLRIYVESGQLEKCAHAMQAIKRAMRWDEETYGREYDLDIYMVVAVSDFNMGAMENKGLNIFNTKYILANAATATDEDYVHIESVIAHEYFHNWSGNRITCRDWFQLSLKEGLTIFRDQHFTADTTSQTVARIQDVNELRLTQFPEDAGPLAHPVRPDSYIEINNFYTATIYNKGAEVIRMLQTLLGKELFRQGMDLYFSKYDGQAVTIEEFVQSMEQVSHLDLTQFRLWYSEKGTPLLTIEDEYDSSQKIYTLKIKQNKEPPLLIPVKMGLLDQSGKEIVSELLQLKTTQATFEFKDIASRPIPSFFRNFSAPVKFGYHYTDADLALLLTADTDDFNRWEAGQKFAANVILKLVADFQDKKPFIINENHVEAVRSLLHAKITDKLFLAELLILPSEKYLAEEMPIVDVDAIHAAREFVLDSLAERLKADFLAIYQANNTDGHHEFNMIEMGRRRLKNVSLHYLMRLKDPLIHEIGFLQFQQSLAENMTDTIAALRALSHIDINERTMALNAFFDQWQQDPLVINKWLSIQAESQLPDAIAHVRALLQHPAFDIKNPNKVYALIGAFGARNPVHFHAATGEGYALLGEVVLTLDALNPNVATRMVKPLTDWQRYDLHRQKLMREQLEKILNKKKISRDLYEIVSKSLEKIPEIA